MCARLGKLGATCRASRERTLGVASAEEPSCFGLSPVEREAGTVCTAPGGAPRAESGLGRGPRSAEAAELARLFRKGPPSSARRGLKEMF